MRKNKKTVAKSDFFRRITIADREIDLCQGENIRWSQIFSFFFKKETGKLLFYDTD